jgi:hypothetical protein
MVPSNNGGGDSNKPGFYSGNAVWESNFAVDPRRGLLYIDTGNNYSVPAGVCTTPQQTGCTPPAADDYVGSILALKLVTRPSALLPHLPELVAEELPVGVITPGSAHFTALHKPVMVCTLRNDPARFPCDPSVTLRARVTLVIRIPKGQCRQPQTKARSKHGKNRESPRRPEGT